MAVRWAVVIVGLLTCAVVTPASPTYTGDHELRSHDTEQAPARMEGLLKSHVLNKDAIQNTSTLIPTVLLGLLLWASHSGL